MTWKATAGCPNQTVWLMYLPIAEARAIALLLTQMHLVSFIMTLNIRIKSEPGVHDQVYL